MRQMIGVLSVALALAWGTSPHAAAQTVSTDDYLNHDQLTGAVQALVGSHGNLASVESFARTHENRDVWLMTLGSGSADDLASRPALLIVANLEANHLVGSSTALLTAEHLLTGYGTDQEITRLLDERTVYIIPRMNPDGAERVWSMPAYELPYKPHPSDPDRGGMNITEMGEDLVGDGFVTTMRIRDAEGTLMVDPDDPRLLREADRTRAERGEYRIMIEGIDPANVDAYVPMGSDGVNLNRNFPHEYLYYQPHVGPHQVSEPETRALADFMFEQVNIAAVITFSPYDNLRSVPPTNRQVPDGVAPGPPAIPTNILAQDRPYHEYISERFREITGLDGDGETGEAGSFAQFAYYQVGIPSFTTPVWTLGADVDGETRDQKWLSLMAAEGIDGFVDWTPATHPQLGEVEVGGFAPNARVNPPPAMVADLARGHADFAVWLGHQLPELEVVETTIEPRGDGVFMVSATIENDRYLPTHFQMGTRVRTSRPITARLMPTDGMTVLTGNIQQQIQQLDGMGGRHTFSWLVQAPAGTNVEMELFAERAGGLQSTTLTLR